MVYSYNSSLDELSRNILLYLDDLGGTATSSQLKDHLDGISTNHLNYRATEKLAPSGLIETHQPMPESGTIPPKQYSLTEEGKETVEKLREEETNHHSLTSRIDDLENRIECLEETINALETKVEEDSIGHAASKGSSEIVEMQTELQSVQSILEGIRSDPLFQEPVRQQLDACRIGFPAFKRVLIEEYGQERIQDIYEQTVNSLDITLLTETTPEGALPQSTSPERESALNRSSDQSESSGENNPTSEETTDKSDS